MKCFLQVYITFHKNQSEKDEKMKIILRVKIIIDIFFFTFERQRIFQIHNYGQ